MQASAVDVMIPPMQPLQLTGKRQLDLDALKATNFPMKDI